MPYAREGRDWWRVVSHFSRFFLAIWRIGEPSGIKMRGKCYICIMQRIRLLTLTLLSLLAFLCFSSAAQVADALLGARKPTRAELRLHRNIENRMSFAVVRQDSVAEDTIVNTPYSRCGNLSAARQVLFPELYFVNAGLLRNGDIWLSRNNMELMGRLVQRYGFTPAYYPADTVVPAYLPMLSHMVRDWYAASGDRECLRAMLPLVEKEYDYLMRNFSSQDGLNLRMAEGGSPSSVAPVDYNSVMYGLERNMAFFMRELAAQGDKLWDRRAADRQRRMRALMVDPVTKRYHDYDYASAGRGSAPAGEAGWVALWSELADKGESAAQAIQPLDSLSTMHLFFALRGLEKGRFKSRADSWATEIVWEVAGFEIPYNASPVGMEGALFQTAYRQLYGADAAVATPRIVNLVQVIRASAPAEEASVNASLPSDSALRYCAVRQMDLMKQYGLKGTVLVRFDALVDTAYQRMLKEQLPEGNEIGAWWEITKPHAEAAGLKWHSKSPTDPRACLILSAGYKPKERERLVDEYMKRFRDIFGAYPRVVGAPLVDAHTLEYMRKKYRVEAVAVSRDRDAGEEAPASFSGGYYQGAWYPSRNNAFMPAQTSGNALDVVSFRFPSVDPLAFGRNTADGTSSPTVTFEPTSPDGGADISWWRRTLQTMLYSPALGEVRMLLGQESACSWEDMARAFERQLPTIARLAYKGDIRVETLPESARIFRMQNSVTPSSALAAVEKRSTADGPGAGIMWFTSRCYRMALRWGEGKLYMQDLRLFDEAVEEPWLREPCTSRSAAYATLPVMDGENWNDIGIRAGIRFCVDDPVGGTRPMRFGSPRMAAAQGSLTMIVPVEEESAGYSFTSPSSGGSRRLKLKGSKAEVCSLDDIPVERGTDFEPESNSLEMVITFTDATVDFTLRPVPGAMAEVPRWHATLEHAPGASVPFSGLASTYDPSMPPSFAMVDAVKDGNSYRLTVENGSVYDTSTSPRTASGAIRALTFVPDVTSLTFRLGK